MGCIKSNPYSLCVAQQIRKINIIERKEICRPLTNNTILITIQEALNLRKYSPDDIDRLLGCPKKITKPPRKEMKAERGSLRNNLELISVDGSDRFSVFLRQNERLKEGFSIGLKYHPADGQSFNVFRCNGPHGNHLDIKREGHSHYHYHIHMVDVNSLNDGFILERSAEMTDGYASFEEAIGFFFKKINLLDAKEYFPHKETQMILLNIDPL